MADMTDTLPIDTTLDHSTSATASTLSATTGPCGSENNPYPTANCPTCGETLLRSTEEWTKEEYRHYVIDRDFLDEYEWEGTSHHQRSHAICTRCDVCLLHRPPHDCRCETCRVPWTERCFEHKRCMTCDGVNRKKYESLPLPDGCYCRRCQSPRALDRKAWSYDASEMVVAHPIPYPDELRSADIIVLPCEECKRRIEATRQRAIEGWECKIVPILRSCNEKNLRWIMKSEESALSVVYDDIRDSAMLCIFDKVHTDDLSMVAPSNFGTARDPAMQFLYRCFTGFLRYITLDGLSTPCERCGSARRNGRRPWMWDMPNPYPTTLRSEDQMFGRCRRCETERFGFRASVDAIATSRLHPLMLRRSIAELRQLNGGRGRSKVEASNHLIDEWSDRYLCDRPIGHATIDDFIVWVMERLPL